MLTSRLDAYISKYGDFCAHDDNDNNDDNDTTDYFTPCACARGNYYAHECELTLNVFASVGILMTSPALGALLFNSMSLP